MFIWLCVCVCAIAQELEPHELEILVKECFAIIEKTELAKEGFVTLAVDIGVAVALTVTVAVAAFFFVSVLLSAHVK